MACRSAKRYHLRHKEQPHPILRNPSALTRCHQRHQCRPPGERMAAHPAAGPVVVLLVQVPPRPVLRRKVAQQRLAELGVGLPGSLRPGPGGHPVVVECAERQVVDVDPDGAAPVGRVVCRVVSLIQAARRRQGPEQGAAGGGLP